MENDFNPFLERGYRSPVYFCDREDETKLLTDYIVNQTNVTLFAFRRLGKTGLIKHIFHKLRSDKNRVCIYLDIYDTVDKSEFINKLATAIYTAFPPKNSLGKKIGQAIQSFRPVISFDELTGLPSVTIAATQTTQQNNTIAGLFTFLDQQSIKIVFAIDEFQQILSYPEKNMEAVLRTQVQQLQNTSFIFCGSNQLQMHEIFNSAKRPFFASCTSLNLTRIEEKKYKLFITKLFKKYDKSITENAVSFICNWTRRHTFYTQYLCNQTFVKSGNNITEENVKEVASGILQVQEGKFYQYRKLLTKAQWKLLTAIAKETQLTQPHAKTFISTYDLGSPSLVVRSLDALVKKEMVLHNIGVEKPYYEVYDKYLMRWMQSK
ncbi:MAG: ATP-binding protein [Flavobacteriales bacterium]|nr:ATP-binding protein [Flavobacteriales bacterium]